MHRSLYLRILPALTAATLALCISASAATRENVTIGSDQSKLIVLPKHPGTVVVGNPIIADVTLDGPRLFVHGRGFGTTNVIVLDEEGIQLSEYEIHVTYDDANAAVVFRNGRRQTVSCAPDCQSVMVIGDNYIPYFATVSTETKLKADIIRKQLVGGDEKGTQVFTPSSFGE